MKKESYLATSPTTILQCPNSPASNGDHHSEITHSTEDDENFISLLQYKDAYHILNITQTPNLSQETIQHAYDAAKEKALYALEQFEETHKGVRRNMFFYSQQNFLELKLLALDQAYDELLSPPSNKMTEKNNNKGKVDQIEQKEGSNSQPDRVGIDSTVSSAAPPMSKLSSTKKSEEEEEEYARATQQPAAEAREFVWNDDGKNSTATNVDAAAKSSPPRSQPQHQRVPSDDELDTIDIYFRPSPSKKDSSNKQHRSKSPNDHPSDVSSCTWDGSSIFSMLSQTKKNIEDAVSESGLDDVLGPKTIQGNKDNSGGGSSSRSDLPPLGINVKHKPTKKSAQISPTSVTDWKVSIHNDDHYDNSSGRKNKSVVGRGRMMKNSRASSSPNVDHHNLNEQTEAARMGILRALSEDNSECLPMDDEYDHRYYLNMSNETTQTHSAKFLKKSSTRGEGINNINRTSSGTSPSRPSAKKFFQGKSDRMPKENNSLMGSVLNDSRGGNRQLSEEPNATLSCRSFERENSASVTLKPTSSQSLSTSSSSARQHQNRGTNRQSKDMVNKNTNDYKNNARDDLLQDTADPYNDVLQAGIDFVDDICNSCLNFGSSPSNGGSDEDYSFVRKLSRAGSVASAAASAALDAAQCELDRGSARGSQTVDDSTVYTRSTYDGDASTYITNGESTAFNTTSSFSQKNGSVNMMSSMRKVPGSRSFSPNTVDSSDPPPRMLV